MEGLFLHGRALLAVLLAALVVSVVAAGAGTAAASQQLQAPVYAVQDLPMMNVTWTTLNGSTVESGSWEVNAWEFGPAPVLRVYNASGGEVGAGAGGYEVAVERGVDYTFSVVVPEELFSELGLDAGYIGVEVFGGIGGTRVRVKAGYNYTTGTWEKKAVMIYFNGTEAEIPFSFTGTSEDRSGGFYTVNVTGHFTDAAPRGSYYCTVKIFDSDGKEVKLGAVGWLPHSMFRTFRVLTLEGVSGFTVQLLDSNGQLLKYVTSGEEFQIVLNTTSPINYAVVGIDKGNGTWIVLKFDQGNFTVEEGVRLSEFEYMVTREGSDNFTLDEDACSSSNTNVTFVGSLNLAEGKYRFTVVNVLDEYGNVLTWLNMPPDPKIIVGEPYIRVESYWPSAAEWLEPYELPELPVGTGDVFSILVDIYGEKRGEVDKVCMMLVPFSLELVEGEPPEFFINLLYNISSGSYAAEGFWVTGPGSNTSMDELPVELLSVASATPGDHLHLNFTLKFNTSNSDFYGPYVVVPGFFKNASGQPVWNVKLQDHADIMRLIAFNMPTFNWFSYSVGEDGSLDLDDNPQTPNYYVRMHSNGTIELKITYNLLRTVITSPPGMTVVARVGYIHCTATLKWNRSYIWTHSDGTPVSDAEMQQINSTIWLDDNVEKLGYIGLGHLTINASIDDLIRNPKYWWITSNVLDWAWLAFDVREVYATSLPGGGLSWSTVEAAFAGILLYVDQDADGVLDMGVSPLLGAADPEEATHVFLISNADSVNLTLPFNGEYGVNGSVTVPGGTQVDFGVRLTGVNGTLFPLKVGNARRVHSVWHFMREIPLYIDPDDFDKSPSHADVTELSLVGHFYLEAGQDNYRGVLKVDQAVGDWNVTTGGSGAQVDLTNRSMAIAYYGRFVEGNYTATFMAEGVGAVDPDSDSMMANKFSFKVSNASIGDFQMGGSTYTLDGTQNYTAYSSTTPVSAFKAMYVAETEESIANITITGETYFMASCFPVWGGEDVDNDPSYISYISTGIYESKPQNLLPLLFLLVLTSSNQGNTGVVAAVAIVAGAGAATLIYWRKKK